MDKSKDERKKYEDAYEADLAMREKIEIEAGENQKFQSVNQYLSMVLVELESTKQALETVKQEAEGYQEEKQKSKWYRSKNRKLRFLSVLELFVLLIISCWFLVYASIQPAAKDVETIANTGKEQGENEVTPGADLEGDLIQTVENLSEIVENTDFSSIQPFIASVEEWYGMECLVFSYKNLKIYYRNEYLESENNRQQIMFDNGTRMMQMNWKYDLSGDLTSLCPSYGQYTDKESGQLLFTQYNKETKQGIPSSLRFVEEDTLWIYDSLDLTKELHTVFDTTYSEDILEGVGQEQSKRMKFQIGKMNYTYALQEKDYINAVFNQEYLIQFEDYFKMEHTEEGLVVSTIPMLSENQFLGEFKAKIVKKENVFVLDQLSFSPYAYPNQEDEEKKGILTPFPEIPEQTIPIYGYQGEQFLIPLSDEITPCGYDFTKLDKTDKNNWIYPMDNGKNAIKGIDVSKYQGNIDWKQVKEAGVEFVMIRLGFRGYGEGTLELDPMFEQNIKGAKEAGLEVGTYFFSQAVNEEEAVEEAEFVLKHVRKYRPTYPIVFDTEHMPSVNARANKLSRQLRTDLCIVFAERIKKAGFTPMIYANTKYMLMGLDLEQLEQYEKWFAYYGSNITMPYHFDMLQYSQSGTIPGIDGAVDLNISFQDFAAEKYNRNAQE